MFKFALLSALILCLIAFAACAGGEEAAASPTQKAEGVLDFSDDTQETFKETDADVRAPMDYGTHASVAVQATTAYDFDDTLYGAAAYVNDGDCPIVITEANFTFRWNGGSENRTFIPAHADYDVVLPGETAYVTCWVNDIESAGAIALEAVLTCERTQKQAMPFAVENARLIGNYPEFATLSGRLINKSRDTFGLSVVQAGFYDESGAFLGAWYFTRNAQLAPEAKKNFVVHLRSLPIPDLAENCAQLETRAFGLM